MMEWELGLSFDTQLKSHTFHMGGSGIQFPVCFQFQLPANTHPGSKQFLTYVVEFL